MDSAICLASYASHYNGFSEQYSRNGPFEWNGYAWVVLVRSDNAIAIFRSADGSTWSEVGAIAMPSLPEYHLCVQDHTIYIGIRLPYTAIYKVAIFQMDTLTGSVAHTSAAIAKSRFDVFAYFQRLADGTYRFWYEEFDYGPGYLDCSSSGTWGTDQYFVDYHEEPVNDASKIIAQKVWLIGVAYDAVNERTCCFLWNYTSTNLYYKWVDDDGTIGGLYFVENNTAGFSGNGANQAVAIDGEAYHVYWYSSPGSTYKVLRTTGNTFNVDTLSLTETVGKGVIPVTDCNSTPTIVYRSNSTFLSQQRGVSWGSDTDLSPTQSLPQNWDFHIGCVADEVAVSYIGATHVRYLGPAPGAGPAPTPARYRAMII